MHSEGMYLPQGIPMLVHGPLSPKMFCYYINLPANSLHLISLTLMIQRTQVHHEVFIIAKETPLILFCLVPEKK